jgi:hypothetical protein
MRFGRLLISMPPSRLDGPDQGRCEQQSSLNNDVATADHCRGNWVTLCRTQCGLARTQYRERPSDRVIAKCSCVSLAPCTSAHLHFLSSLSRYHPTERVLAYRYGRCVLGSLDFRLPFDTWLCIPPWVLTRADNRGISPHSRPAARQ